MSSAALSGHEQVCAEPLARARAKQLCDGKRPGTRPNHPRNADEYKSPSRVASTSSSSAWRDEAKTPRRAGRTRVRSSSLFEPLLPRAPARPRGLQCRVPRLAPTPRRPKEGRGTGRKEQQAQGDAPWPVVSWPEAICRSKTLVLTPSPLPEGPPSRFGQRRSAGDWATARGGPLPAFRVLASASTPVAQGAGGRDKHRRWKATLVDSMAIAPCRARTNGASATTPSPPSEALRRPECGALPPTETTTGLPARASPARRVWVPLCPRDGRPPPCDPLRPSLGQDDHLTRRPPDEIIPRGLADGSICLRTRCGGQVCRTSWPFSTGKERHQRAVTGVCPITRATMWRVGRGARTAARALRRSDAHGGKTGRGGARARDSRRGPRRACWCKRNEKCKKNGHFLGLRGRTVTTPSSGTPRRTANDEPKTFFKGFRGDGAVGMHPTWYDGPVLGSCRNSPGESELFGRHARRYFLQGRSRANTARRR